MLTSHQNDHIPSLIQDIAVNFMTSHDQMNPFSLCKASQFMELVNIAALIFFNHRLMPIAYGEESNFLPYYYYNLSTPGIIFAYFDMNSLYKKIQRNREI